MNKDDRVWVTVPMEEDMKVRIKKAAARNSQAVSEYVRTALISHMQENNEWSLPGPRKGAT
jgi:hypothetical protein